jgi:type I restriction enzyme S subunit
MELRPGYRKTEIGVIPEDWSIQPLSTVVEGLLAGISVNSSDDALDATEGGKGVLKTSAIFDGHFDPSEQKAIALRDLGRARLSPKQGAVLISRMNTPDLVGECGYVETDMPDLFIPDRIWMTAYRRDVELSKRWLALLLSSKPIKTRIKGIATGTSGSMKNIAKDAMLGLLLPFPTPPEQKAIAEALTDVDASIAALSRLIAKKRDLRQGAMQRLLTGQTRLPGFTTPWQQKRLGECLLETPSYGINAPAVPFSDRLPRYIRITDISEDGRFDPRPLVSVAAASSRYLLEPGDLVFARTGASVGKSYLYDSADGELVYAGFLIRVRPDPRLLVSKFLAGLTTTKDYWNWVKLMSMRSGQPGINGQEYAQFGFQCPGPEEQAAISQMLVDMDGEIAALDARLDKTRALKQATMQALLTGRVRLPVRRDVAVQTMEAAHA